MFDIAVAYRYRLNEEKAEWIIYVTDVGQQQHFDMFFKVCTYTIVYHCILIGVASLVLALIYSLLMFFMVDKCSLTFYLAFNTLLACLIGIV